jgi:hypothetical protein
MIIICVILMIIIYKVEWEYTKSETAIIQIGKTTFPIITTAFLVVIKLIAVI